MENGWLDWNCSEDLFALSLSLIAPSDLSSYTHSLHSLTPTPALATRIFRSPLHRRRLIRALSDKALGLHFPPRPRIDSSAFSSATVMPPSRSRPSSLSTGV